LGGSGYDDRVIYARRRKGREEIGVDEFTEEGALKASERLRRAEAWEREERKGEGKAAEFREGMREILESASACGVSRRGALNSLDRLSMEWERPLTSNVAEGGRVPFDARR